MKFLSAIALFGILANTSFAGSEVLTLPRGAVVKTYRATPAEAGSISGCGLYSNLKSKAIASHLILLKNESPFHQTLVLDQEFPLTLENIKVRHEKGTDCNYRGFAMSDPDWHCSDSINGFWTDTTITFADSYGNSWAYGDKSDFVASADKTFTDQDAEKMARENLAKAVSHCSARP